MRGVIKKGICTKRGVPRKVKGTNFFGICQTGEPRGRSSNISFVWIFVKNIMSSKLVENTKNTIIKKKKFDKNT